MPTPNPTTVKELVAYLRRSNLPTLVVEGPDDVRIYKWLIHSLGYTPQDVALLPTGGRPQLLDVYQEVSKDKPKNIRVPIVFIADQDMWVFTGIPKEYNNLIVTKGYSIENDLYSYADLESLLDFPDEVNEHSQVLDVIIEWFAFEVQQYLKDEDSSVARDLKDIVPRGTTRMSSVFRQTRGFNPPKPYSIPEKIIHEDIKKNYHLKVRGKYLFDLLIRYLNYQSRHTRHDRKTLQENAFKRPDNSNQRDQFIDNIRRKFKEEENKITRLTSS